MMKIYEEKKPKPFSVPQGIKFINVDLKTGKPSDKNYVQEAFKNNFSFEKDKSRSLSIDITCPENICSPSGVDKFCSNTPQHLELETQNQRESEVSYCQE